ncbi:MAG: 2-dehydropantoate 2-reductase [Lachnospiraceae bacterium]|nr:2-dehydropantoate 2-reductase [Lachnospiraceae bacterium]
MHIYVDFDDCLCETARDFSVLLYDLFKKDVPYEKIKYFNLQKAFDLDDEKYEELMRRGHEAEVLLRYEETPGAAEVLNEWVDLGHQVSIITGRPFGTYEASRLWLDRHGFERIRLYCLNKYGRESAVYEGGFSLELEDYYKMHFDYAIEDSTTAFKFFDHLPDLKVLVFDRPWNQSAELPGNNYRRCRDWKMIRELVK